MAVRHRQVLLLEPGEVLAPGQRAVRPGRDLLWRTGDFEQRSVHQTDPLLWSLGKYATASDEAACDGQRGLRLQRSPVSREDVIATTDNRIPVRAGQRLTLRADVSLASAGATLELRWYRHSTGPSSDAVVHEIPQRSSRDGCSTVTLDARAPRGVVAVQPYLRLSPPRDYTEILASELRIDTVSLIAWGRAGQSGVRYDAARRATDGPIKLVAAAAPRR